MTRVSTFKEAKALGLKFSVHVLNQPDKADNGWHYFATAAELAEFKAAHPDPLNDDAPSFNIF